MSEPEQEQVPAWLRAEYRLLSLTILVGAFALGGYCAGRNHMAQAVYGEDIHDFLKMDRGQGVETVIVGVSPGRACFTRRGGWDMAEKGGHTFLVCTSKERARKVVEKCVEAWEKEGSSREELR